MAVTELTSLGRKARAARLDPLAAQRVFDALLHTLANPGVPATIAVPAGVPPALLPAVTLADVEVTMTVLTDDDWADAVFAVTGARRAALADAGLVVALRPVDAGEVRSLCRGTAEAPESAARLVAAVEAIGGDAGTELTLRGPGVPGVRQLCVRGLDPAVVRALAEANTEFPAGVDAHLVAADGTVASIPRGTEVRVAREN
ncbi:MAG: phosphonate C-P lyase system protein PhnH [Streptosporangiales bacterium]|nr:phosphonate C-P lyase system protein PhnH [Streptosporangiales bacterium]